MVKTSYTIKNEEGLHARPAALIAKKASEFKSKISLLKNGEAFEAKSILMLMCIAAEKGETIEIQADGEDEQEALDALLEILNNL